MVVVAVCVAGGMQSGVGERQGCTWEGLASTVPRGRLTLPLLQSSQPAACANRALAVSTPARFTGNISDAWAGKNSFTKLKTLNLANNDLSGTLPNWNRLGAWRSLETLDLSNNKFYGEPPTPWGSCAAPGLCVARLSALCRCTCLVAG